MGILREKIFHPRAAVKSLAGSLPITIALLAAASFVSTILFHFSQNVTNISIIFILAIILIARATRCYSAGILASLYSVFWVNYAYTYPYMAFNFTLSGYPVTFVGMTVISCFTSSICIMLTRQGEQLKEQERKLMAAEKEAMRANLLRAISHDLRTPLTTIIGSSTTYLEQEDALSPEDRRQLVHNIEEDAQWLLNMVENLLSVTRIQDDKGAVSVAKSEEPLEEVISEAVQRFKKRFPDMEIHVSMPDALIMVPMDPILIAQVINNLLENAFFHSGNRRIDLYVQTTPSDVCITIRDYGKGIPQEILHSLFDGAGMNVNRQGDSHKGMGIGLTLCKTIVAAHGGTISASNHPNGAQFTFTLPNWREY